MKFVKLTIAVLLVMFAVNVSIKADDLNRKKMEQVTKEILDMMVKGDNASEKLRKYISEDWLESKRLNVKKYLINNYSPESFEIIYSGGDVCIATIGGSSWQHLLVFKFIEEYGAYKVVPKGISDASSEYIDPWNYVKDYICSAKDMQEPLPPEEK
ncbi:MAG TPA: hypothetical protein PK605_15840 [Ignavibacteria bacterium]|nr:hypothetical protein [Bacteroidota bacterium]HRE10913.1 hypothetical protein [Ignavibacteria bacterium]HRF66698.1 hypothetical protein [Ignavibacteria bacterium]HRJ05874.1 hypothetical protein [Ignavibacteria bacterium]